MYIFDRKFRKNHVKYLLQCGFAVLTAIGVLLFLDIRIHAAIIATLGATIFTIFSMPNTSLSKTRTVMGGYIIGMTSGMGFYGLSIIPSVNNLVVSKELIYIVCGACAIGISMFLMSITNTEHAPAAGMSLGLVLNKWDIFTIVFILVAVFLVLTIKHLFHAVFMNLIGEEREI